MGSHCIGNKKLSVHKKHASATGGFCYSFVDARNPGPYDLLSCSFGTGDPKIGPVIVEICKRTNVPLYLQLWIGKTTQGVEGSVLTECGCVTLHLAFAFQLLQANTLWDKVAAGGFRSGLP